MAKMPNYKHFLLMLTSIAFCLMHLNFVQTLPTAVTLGGAIVAAVEEDETSQDTSSGIKQKQLHQWNLNNFNTNHIEKTDFVELRNISANEKIDHGIHEGRGKFHKKNKMLKQLYPLLIGTVLAKTVLLPLVLKVLTAISTSSFIMAKIALGASGLLALKWILTDNVKERTHFEIVHLPPKHAIEGGNLGYNTIDWSDLSWSGSNYVDVQTKPNKRLKYIPLKGGSSGSATNAMQGLFPGVKVMGTASNNGYSYEKNLNGMPFL